MKKLYTTLLILASAFLQAQIVNIPDINFKNALLDRGVDTNGDGEIQVSEAEAITILSVGSREILSLEGIQSFVNLEELYCALNELTVLDLSQNVHLQRLDCWYNQLTDINVTQSTNLNFLWCIGNNLTTLDLSQNINLEVLWADDNQISDLDVTNNNNLRHFFCARNQLTELDVSQNLNLEWLGCAQNPLEELDVSANLQLHTLEIQRTSITSLDLISNIHIEELYVGGNELEILKINNGNNHNIRTMISEGNANLRCIQVDDETATYPECSDWLPKEGWCIDPWTSYSEDCSLGIESIKNPSFTIYPNPVSAELTISESNNKISQLKAEIYSVEGKMMFLKDLENEKIGTIDVSGFSEGMYFLKLVDEKGNMAVKKFIKI